MIHASGRGWMLAAGAALSFHLVLFVAVEPSRGNAADHPAPPPRTRYLLASTGDAANAESDVRTVRSPVVFSLPSTMGFSQELLNNDVRTKLSFLQPVKTEHFFEDETAPHYFGERLAPLELMISGRVKDPSLPVAVVDIDPPRLIATRVVLASELKVRLVGGIVLPPELNRSVETPWEVHASISISEQGAVRHILLEQPLASPERNQQVLRLLYSLRFKAGEPTESAINIYSPEADGGLIQ
jgi:hypothetical protein